MTTLGIKELVVLVADTHMESTMNALLARPVDLGSTTMAAEAKSHEKKHKQESKRDLGAMDGTIGPRSS